MKTITRLEVNKVLGAVAKEREREILLQVYGLGKSFGGQIVLKDVSVSLRLGEVVLLLGSNGSGKTTFLNMLTGNLKPDVGEIHLSSGKKQQVFRFPSPWQQELNSWNHFTPERLAQEGIGRTWQEVRLFPSLSLLDNITAASPQQKGENPISALFQHSLIRKQEMRLQNEARLKLEDLGLQGRESSLANKISLGQSKRVAIARAIQAGAKILFLDEPLASLDRAGILEVVQWLKTLVREQQLTLVIVEHVLNIPHILDLVTKVWMLEQGELRVELPAMAQKYLAELQHNDIRNWLAKVSGGKISDRILAGGAVLSTVGEASVPLLEVEDLVVYRGKRLVVGEQHEDGTVTGISFTLYRGQVALLQAPNGWGKTSLLEALAGAIAPAQGKIRLSGRLVEKLPSWKRVKLGLSLLQSRDNIYPNLTVREALQLSHVRNIPEDVKPLLHKRMSDLSGGEKQRVILRCFQSRLSNVQLIDEPLSALDAVGVDSVLEILKPNTEKSCLIAVPSIIHTKES